MEQFKLNAFCRSIDDRIELAISVRKDAMDNGANPILHPVWPTYVMALEAKQVRSASTEQEREARTEQEKGVFSSQFNQKRPHWAVFALYGKVLSGSRGGDDERTMRKACG